MTAAPAKDTDMRIKLSSSQPITDIDYRRTVKEVDTLWETETTDDKQYRMVELLRQIETYESANSTRSN